jgi:hypothetical protein
MAPNQHSDCDGSQDEQEAALFKSHVRSQSVDVGYLQDNDIAVEQSPMTTQQHANRECDMAEAITRDADNLAGPEECRLPAAELEVIESQGQQINKMDEKPNTLEARILRLNRELDECKQEAAGVLQQKNELCEQFEDNSKKYAARLKADIKKTNKRWIQN